MGFLRSRLFLGRGLWLAPKSIYSATRNKAKGIFTGIQTDCSGQSCSRGEKKSAPLNCFPASERSPESGPPLRFCFSSFCQQQVCWWDLFIALEWNKENLGVGVPPSCLASVLLLKVLLLFHERRWKGPWRSSQGNHGIPGAGTLCFGVVFLEQSSHFMQCCNACAIEV